MSTNVQSVYLDIPKKDMKFFRELAKKMGWNMGTKASYLERYISSRPKDVSISEDDIVEEASAVRYRK